MNGRQSDDAAAKALTMSDTSSAKKPNSRNRNLLVLAIAVIVAVGVGGIVGAFAYRERVKDNNREVAAVTDYGRSGITDPAGGFPLGNRYPAQFTTETIYPRFNPDRRYYVTRCVPGKIDVEVRAEAGTTVKVGAYPPLSGHFAAEARPLPGQDFTVTIDDGSNSDDYEIRCLPDDFPFWEYKRFKAPPKGMFFMSYRPDPKDENRNWATVFDQDGTPVWWMPTQTNTLGGQILRDGTVQYPRGFGDGFGKDPRAANEVRTLDGRLIRLVRVKGAPTDGHEYTLLPNGNVLIVSYKPRYPVDLSSVGGEKVSGTLDGYIQEQTPSGKVVWSWSSADHIPLSDTAPRWWKRLLGNPHENLEGHDQIDIFHLNTVEPYGKDQYVISSRHTDAVFGISRKTGDVLWKFGGVKTPESLKIEGDDPNADYPIAGNHDARMTGNILSVHDNATNIEGRRPRMVRYRIDLENRTATYVGQGTDPKVTKSHCCGGVRPFGTGWLVAWGNNPYVSAFNSKDALAFRMKVPIPVYRAVPVPPQVTEADLNAAMDRMELPIPQSKEPVNPPKVFEK